jgi:hypothetical protein
MSVSSECVLGCEIAAGAKAREIGAAAHVSLTKVDVIGCHYVVERRQAKAFFRLENPVQITTTILCKLQEKFLFLAAMSDVPDVTREKMTISLGIVFFLQAAFSGLKSYL